MESITRPLDGRAKRSIEPKGRARSGNALKKLTPVIFLVVLTAVLTVFAVPMGVANMLSTLMNTAYEILINTTLYIMAIAVMMGALSALLTEFGVVGLINKLVSPLMRPLYDLPGAASIGVITTYLSDNPAILCLADDKGFRRYFKKYQLPALTNLGTSFGMGLIVTTFMLGLGGTTGVSLVAPVIVGNIAALIGSVVSTRIMLFYTKRLYGKTAPADSLDDGEAPAAQDDKPKQGLGLRVMNALLTGGKSGVTLGLGIIPGVLIICTIVMMLTNSAPAEGFTGGAYEGIGLLPKLAEYLNFIIKPLFGFQSASAIAVPITALGSAGAAMGLVPTMLSSGAASVHDVAVFTAMCMCWSGYLSTHVSMMDSLNCRELTGKAILSHTIGGLVAGVAANWLYVAAAAVFSL